jgi:hypothetical protein
MPSKFVTVVAVISQILHGFNLKHLVIRENIQPGNYTPIPLTSIGQNELEVELNKTGNQSQVAVLAKENFFFLFAIRDQKRQINNQALRLLRNKLVMLIFPCGGESFGHGIIEMEPPRESPPQ